MKSMLENAGKTCILAKTPFSIKVVGCTLGIIRVVNMAKHRIFDIGQRSPSWKTLGKRAFWPKSRFFWSKALGPGIHRVVNVCNIF